MGESGRDAPPSRSWPAVVVAWLLLSALSQLPYLAAAVNPPPGRAFLGFFYYVDDQYNYFSYVGQAERGRFLFDNAVILDPHPPRLVNLEWWLTGRLSALLGGRPFLAWRILAALASLALLFAADRWLAAVGVSATRRFPALLLVGTGAGLGGLAWRLGWIPLQGAVDLTDGVFPAIEMLANPHFATGTALLAWTLLLLFRAEAPRQQGLAILVGTCLGLVRPYDLATVAGARILGVLAARPPAEWGRRLIPLVGFVPVAGYVAWLLFAVSWFSAGGLRYVVAEAPFLALAVAPAAALAALSFATPAAAPERAARLHLAGWLVVVAAVITLRPVGFPMQFAVGAGLPLLVLAAAALTRWPPFATGVAAAAFSTTAACALALLLSDNPRWYVHPEPRQIADALRRVCAAGEVAFAPPDVGLYVLGLTACKPYVSHEVEPAHAERRQAVERFYGDVQPSERAALLDAARASYVVLPDAGEAPEVWLGPSPFRRVAVAGAPPLVLALYARTAGRAAGP